VDDIGVFPGLLPLVLIIDVLIVYRLTRGKAP
jgi:hypothetical protein